MTKEKQSDPTKTQGSKNHQTNKGSEKESILKDGEQLIIIPFNKVPTHLIDRYQRGSESEHKREEL